MRRSELTYVLPSELIAYQPIEPRDAARLMVVHRATGRIEHRRFCDIVDYFRRGDLVVLNNTKVVPARFFCRRASGGQIEGLFLRAENGEWRALLKPTARLRTGEHLTLENAADTTLELLEHTHRGEWRVRPSGGADPFSVLARAGEVPLPPYIQTERRAHGAATLLANDATRYQTVYAERPGAVAAPTAGLHFTPELLEKLRLAGVARSFVTLHVGLGTFEPIQVDDLSGHRMHREWYEAPIATLQSVVEAKGHAARVFGVGTTACRVLESVARTPAGFGQKDCCADWTELFLYPPATFHVVDALLTNFHLPESTLLALVMAFSSIDLIRHAYEAAIAEKYRFYSYGDAMLIL